MLLTNLLHHFYVHKVLTFIPDSFKYIIHDEIQIFLLLFFACSAESRGFGVKA